MRFLHLSDLHLGKSIYETSLIDSGDQAYWVDRFIDLARDLKPDAVVIAGDVYDRSQPPAAAAKLLNHLITELAKMKIVVLMITGNHDSIYHLSFLSSLLEEKKVFISKPLEQPCELVHTAIEDEHGPVHFWLLPYVSPAGVASVLQDDEIKDYDTAVRRVLAEQPIDFTQRNVLIAHQNVTANGQEVVRGGSESMVGGVGQVDYTAFDGFDYVALGHIHSSYSVGRETVRYAGTPMAYHFNETKQPAKGPLLVTLAGKDETVRIERQDIEPLHRMREIRGEYDQIRAEMIAKSWVNEYLKIVLTDQRVSPQATFLREKAKENGSHVMELTSEFSSFGGGARLDSSREVREKTVEKLFADFYTSRKDGIEPDDKDLELMAFVGKMTREIVAAQGKPEDSDFKKILDFAMKQEVNQK